MSAKRNSHSPHAKLLSRAGVLVFYLGLWALLARLVNQPLLLPSPAAVLERLIVLLPDPLLYQSLIATLTRTLCAYALGILAAAALSLLCIRSKAAELLLSPLLSAIRATPVTSFIVLALVWLSSPRVPVLTGFLMTLPVVYSALVQAIRSIDPQLLEMAQMYGFSRLKTLLHVCVPSVLPAFLQSCLAAIGLCWKAVVAAEVIGVPKQAVGSRIYESKIYLETESLMAWTLMIILLSVLLEALLRRGASRLTQGRFPVRALTHAAPRPLGRAADASVTLDHLSMSFGEKSLFDDLTMTFSSPGHYALLGPSGRGKTTLLRMIAGLLPPASGRAIVGENARVAFCFQEDRLLPWKSVRENVALVCRSDEEAQTWLERVGLGSEGDSMPASLSGGMQRRVALARALAFDADILLMDEPFRALDDATHEQMLLLLRSAAQGKLLILVTHDETDTDGMQAIRL